MRTVLIDCSGSLPAIAERDTRKLLRVGDRVIMFDTNPYERGTMQSQADIRDLQFLSGGGSLLSETLRLVAKTAPNIPILLLTDGYVGDIAESTYIVEKHILRITDIIDVAGLGNVERLKEHLIL